MRIVRKKRLEIEISKIPPHPHPNPLLEQYVTPPSFASRLLWIAETVYKDISGKKVADLGCGTGRLAIGCSLLGAAEVLCIDIDRSSIEVSLPILLKESSIDIVVGDIALIPLRQGLHTVVMNPPFGVHRRGADIMFLCTALKIASVVFSVHKHGNEDYVSSRARECGAQCTPLYKDYLLLPPTMDFHEKKWHKIRVTVFRCVHT